MSGEIMKSFIYFFLCLGVVLMLASGCDRPEQQGHRSEATSGGGAGSQMVHFILPSAVDGNPVDSDSFKGKALLVTFFATWCPPCRDEIPALIALQEEYQDQGFTVLGLSVDEDGAEIVKALLEKTGVNYPVLMADSAVAKGFGGVNGIPTSFLVDKSGNIVLRYIGYTDHDVMSLDVKNILAVSP